MITNQSNKAIFFLKIAFFTLIFTVALITYLINFVKNQEGLLENKIYPNVYIDSQNIGRLSKKDAIKIASKKYKNLNRVRISIKLENDIIATMSAKKLELSNDVKEIVDRAYLIGRSPYFLSRSKQGIFSILNFEKYNFYSSIKYKKREIDEFISLTEEKYNKPAKNALFKFENNKVVQFRPEEEGISIDSDKFLFDVNKSIYELKTKQENKTESILIPSSSGRNCTTLLFS